MAYEQSKFGYAGGSTTADSYGVHNHYGARNVGKTQGSFKTDGVMQELVIDLDGEMVDAGGFALLAPVLPKGAIVTDVYVEVTEAFVLGGTTPTIEIGTEGSEATNGVSITEAQAEAVGSYDVTSAVGGTWAAGLAAATTVGVALDGTTPTSTDAGKARVVIRYAKS